MTVRQTVPRLDASSLLLLRLERSGPVMDYSEAVPLAALWAVEKVDRLDEKKGTTLAALTVAPKESP